MDKVFLCLIAVAGVYVLNEVFGFEVDDAPEKEEKEAKTKILWQQSSNGRGKYRGPGKWR